MLETNNCYSSRNFGVPCFPKICSYMKLDVPMGCSTLQALIIFSQHLFVMTAGIVRYYDQITISPPHLLPPITAPNQFVSLIGCAARSRRTSFTTTAVILTSRMTLTFSYITLMGVQFCKSASTPLHLSRKLTYDSSLSTTRQLTVQLCASYSICRILTQVCKIKFITSSRNTGPISTIKGNSSPSKITSVSSTVVQHAQSVLRKSNMDHTRLLLCANVLWPSQN